jgi:hypothetical protein
MKKLLVFCFAVLLVSGVSQAQSGGMAGHDHSAPPPDQAKEHEHHGAAGHDQMAGMHEKMMKDMQADMDGMKANLQKMKDLLAKTKDASAKEQLQLNVNMWQSVVDNMDKHMQMMKHMHDMGMGGGMGMGGHDMHGKSMEGHDKGGHDMQGKGMDCGKMAPTEKPATPEATKKPN